MNQLKRRIYNLKFKSIRFLCYNPHCSENATIGSEDKIISNIELKAEGFVEDVVQVIEQFVADRGWSYDNFIVSSFDHHQLKKFKQLCSVVKIITLIEAIPLTYAQCAQDLNSEYLGLWKGSINQAFVKDAHARGIKVLVYTINSSYELETITLLGVDGIFSDFPDIF